MSLGVIARSEGMSEIAKNTTIQRPALYKNLRKILHHVLIQLIRL